MRDLRAALFVCSACLLAPSACSKAGTPTSEAPTATASDAAARGEAPTPATAHPAAPAEANPSVASVIGAVLDSRPMTMYLHPELEGRVPVAVSGPALAGATIEVIAQGQPVQVLTEAEVAAAADKACVIFERIELGEATAEVQLRYPIEGILGRFVLEREGEGWRIIKAELAER